MERTIVITGVGFTSTSPDQISVSFRLETKSPVYKEAQKELEKKTEKLQQSIKNCNLSLDDLKTESWKVRTITRLRSDGQEVFYGYQFHHTLILNFDLNLHILNQLLQTVSAQHIDPSLKVNFTLKDPTSVKKELLISATQDARKKAEILASASGVSLGKLLRIDYSWGEIQISSSTHCEDGCFSDIMSIFSTRSSIEDIRPKEIENRERATFIWEIV